MRKLYPTNTNNTGKLVPLNKQFNVTQEDWNSLLSDISDLNERLDNDELSLEQWKSAISNSFTTIILNASNATISEATISDLTATLIEATGITSENITADVINSVVSLTTERLAASYANITEETVQQSTISELTASNAEIQIAHIAELETGNFNPKTATIDTLTSNTSSIDTATISTLSSTEAEIDNAEISEATVTDLTATEANVTDLYSEKIYNHYFNHNQEFNKQIVTDDSVSADGDYYIVLPKFRNGTYYLIAKNGENGPYLWSMEIVNSVKNITFSWSVNSEYAYLQDVEVIEDSSDETQFIQIHCKTNSSATHIWHQCTDYNTQTPPSIYGTKQYDGTQQFEITQQKGNYMPNAVFVGDFHAEHLIIEDIQFDKVTVLKQIELASGYDAYGEPLGTTTGIPNQYIKNIEVNGQIRTQWTSPAEQVERDNENLITSDAVSEYDGQVDLGEDPLDPTQHIYDYPITHLGNDTVVHGKATANEIEVTDEAKLPNLYNGPEANFDATEYASDSVVIFTEVNDPSDYTANKLYRLRKTLTNNYLEEIIATSTLTDQKPVIYDAETNTLKTTNELDITDIKSDTIIVDDLTVNGTAHINNTEEETVVGNFVTLRTNNQAGLTPGEYSGMLVNNFKVGEICAIVVDSNGIARVGHATGTETTYADLYYTNDKYYTDAELTTEVTPAGVMISWDDKEVVDGVEHWTNAVWKVLNFDSTQALLTRKEDVDMNDKGILLYDKTSHRSETIALPTKDEQTLEAHVVEEAGETTISYRWKDKQAGSYVYATMTDYEADAANVPVGSQIIIEDEMNYLTGEDL